MFKKSFLFLVLIFVFLGFGCQKKQEKENIKGIKTLSTIAMIGSLVNEIGGEFIQNKVLIKGELDPHTYELVKGDDQKFKQAKVVFCNGLSLEHGISLRQSLKQHSNVVVVTDPILKEGEILYAEGQHDPHVWMDVALWVKTLDPIVFELSSLDPEHKKYFEENKIVLEKTLLDLHQYACELFSRIPDQSKFLVTGHNAFHYFVKRYLSKIEDPLGWEKRCTAPEGLAPEAQVSPSDIQEVMNFMTYNNVGVVFPESNVNKDALKKIVAIRKKQGKHTNVSSKDLLSDSMGSAKSYYEMMRHNIEQIAKGLETQ